MNINQFAITTTATQIISNNDASSGTSTSVTVKNLGPQMVYLGSVATQATSTGGYPLSPGEVLTVTVPYVANLPLWAATAVDSASVAILEP